MDWVVLVSCSQVIGRPFVISIILKKKRTLNFVGSIPFKSRIRVSVSA